MKTGVLMVNVGTPSAATATAVRAFLSPFLRDPRVIDLPRWLWYPLLYGFILPRRCRTLAQRYQAIWNAEGSPLAVYSRRQQQALSEQLTSGIVVQLGMTYGQPSLGSAIQALLTQGVERVIVLPLFPQYSSTTTAAVWDQLAQVLKRYRRLPQIHFIRDYATHPLYIQALKQQLQAAAAQYGKPDKWLFSYHGIPKRYGQQGDDYAQRCQATTAAIVSQLSLSSEQWEISYQSRFGYAAWLTPYTEPKLRQLARQGVKHLQVICPGFASDCLETLGEIQQQGRAIFIKAGGERFHYIPALNDSIAHFDLLYALVQQALTET
ncbi:MAG: ferrochelatase [Candidatus Symbiodolus clandestinus]